MSKNQYQGLGRRKTSVARVYLIPGNGNIIINKRNIDDYFHYEKLVKNIKKPLILTKNEKKFDINVNVKGSGFTGQSDAIVLGISRALLKVNEEYRTILKEHNLLKRDSRKVERKKYGLKKARRAPQFSKR